MENDANYFMLPRKTMCVILIAGKNGRADDEFAQI